MVRISNYMVFVLNYFIAFFFCFYSVEFIKSDLLDFKILANPKASIKNGVPAQLYKEKSSASKKKTESSKIHVSENTMALTSNAFDFSQAIEMEIKGKGMMKTYFLR